MPDNILGALKLLGEKPNAVIISTVGTTENPHEHCEHISEVCGAYMVA